MVYVNAGTILVPAEGYDVSGNTQKNVDVYTATVKGKGNYKGSVTAQYSIVPANANLFEVILSQEVYTPSTSPTMRMPAPLWLLLQVRVTTQVHRPRHTQ